jgi:tetratricopeptide (TPR) repeat protein
LVTQANLSLRDYLQRYPIAVVVDNAEDVLQQPQELSELLREMSAAVVLLTSSSYTPLPDVNLHVPPADLDEKATFALVRELLQSHLNELREQDVAPWIWDQIGGNPLAVKIATSMLAYGDMAEIRTLAREQTVGRAFEHLGQDARLCWCALSLLLGASASLPDLAALWYDDTFPAATSELLRFFLVEQSGDIYTLATSAADFVRQQCIKHDQIQALYEQLLDGMAMQAYRSVDVAQQILLKGWHSPGERLEWIARFWRAGLDRGHFVQWCTIFEGDFRALSPELYMAYGVCLRRAGQWEAAQQIFQLAVHESGRMGDFGTQSAILLEWATSARLQGDYTRAVSLLQQARRCNVHQDEGLFHRIQIEQSQIALDKGDGSEALDILRDLAQSVDTAILSSKALLLLGFTDRCRVTALQALEHATEDRRIEASLYTLVGRSYDVQAQYEAAWAYFALALTVLEPTEDISAIARAQANLAAVLLKLRKMQEAQALLDRANPVLAMLGDKVGQHAALHYQRLTNSYWVHFN